MLYVSGNFGIVAWFKKNYIYIITNDPNMHYYSAICKSIFLYCTINTLIQQGCIKLFKTDSKYICNATKDFYFKQMLSFKLSIHQRILKKSSMVFHTVFIDYNKKCFLTIKTSYSNDF